MSNDDDILDIFEELSAEREGQRDRKHQEKLRAEKVTSIEIVDTGEGCVGG
jgi:hypothetical protein